MAACFILVSRAWRLPKHPHALPLQWLSSVHCLSLVMYRLQSRLKTWAVIEVVICQRMLFKMSCHVWKSNLRQKHTVKPNASFFIGSRVASEDTYSPCVCLCMFFCFFPPPSTNLHVFPSRWLVFCPSPTHTEGPWDPAGSEAKSKLVGTNLYQCILLLSDRHVSHTGVISSVPHWDLMSARNAVCSSAEWWYSWTPEYHWCLF